ncbi:MAG: hypothetical protein KC776_11050 [Myxococcales bacterium]|nr:hypothetical protein [Myxococcales bacterium]MCB9580107.1 hypothetical protein [Polyangiaceae bacterium]
MTQRKLTRRESLQLASSAVALGAGLGVGLLGGKATAATPQVSIKWEFFADGVKEPLAVYTLPAEALKTIKEQGASALTVRLSGESPRGLTALGGFKLPAAVQIKMEKHLGR